MVAVRTPLIFPKSIFLTRHTNILCPETFAFIRHPYRVRNTTPLRSLRFLLSFCWVSMTTLRRSRRFYHDFITFMAMERRHCDDPTAFPLRLLCDYKTYDCISRHFISTTVSSSKCHEKTRMTRGHGRVGRVGAGRSPACSSPAPPHATSSSPDMIFGASASQHDI